MGAVGLFHLSEHSRIAPLGTWKTVSRTGQAYAQGGAGLLLELITLQKMCCSRNCVHDTYTSTYLGFVG